MWTSFEKAIAETLTKMVLLSMITLIWKWNYGSNVLPPDYHIYLIGKLMAFWKYNNAFNQIDLLYKHALKYYHYSENYQQSILQDIIPFGLRLKNKAAMKSIPHLQIQNLKKVLRKNFQTITLSKRN